FHDILNSYQSLSIAIIHHHHLRVRDDDPQFASLQLQRANKYRHLYNPGLHARASRVSSSASCNALSRTARNLPLSRIQGASLALTHPHASIGLPPANRGKALYPSRQTRQWSPYRMYVQDAWPAARVSRRLAFIVLGGRNLGERDLPFPALFMSRCSSLPSHPVLTFPPSVSGIKSTASNLIAEPRSSPPAFPASFSPTLPQPHIREKAHTKSEIPLNLSESSVRRVATVPPSCQFAHGPLCICDHLVSRPLLLPPSATLLLGWNARPPFGRVLRATTGL
ncbi:hypothetical protein N5P37_008361, partial [Trichoderma harzianum]